MLAAGTSTSTNTISGPVWLPRNAELVELLSGREALHAFSDDEGGGRARAELGFGLGVDHHRVGVGAVGDPHLVPLKQVEAALVSAFSFIEITSLPAPARSSPAHDMSPLISLAGTGRAGRRCRLRLIWF